MAGRFNTYKPNEFVKLPYDDIVKAMAMREQQYQQGYLAPSAYQQEMNKIDVRAVDRPYAQQLQQEAVNKANALAKDVYGGDYGAAALDITKGLAESASDPFYKFNKTAFKDEEEAKKIKAQLTAEGKYLGFNEDIFNKAYYDSETGEKRTDIKSDLQRELDYSKAQQDIWNYAIHEEGGSSKGKIADAETQAKAGKLFLEIPKTSWEGVTGGGNFANVAHGKGQVDRKFIGALTDYMGTTEYTQQKKKLHEKMGMSEEDADKKIASDMYQVGMLKTYKKYKDDTTIISNPIAKSTGDDEPSGITPLPETQNMGNKITDKAYETSINSFNNLFKTITHGDIPFGSIQKRYTADWKAPDKAWELQNKIADVNKKIILLHGPGTTQNAQWNIKNDALLLEKNQLNNQVNQLKNNIASYTKEEINEMRNHPAMKQMSGFFDNTMKLNIPMEEKQKILSTYSSIIKGNKLTVGTNYTTSLQSPEIMASLRNNIKDAKEKSVIYDKNGFGFDNIDNTEYTQNEIATLLSKDASASAVIDGLGNVIVNMLDDNKIRSIKIPHNRFKDEKSNALRGINTAFTAYNAYTTDDKGQKITEDPQISYTPISVGGHKYYTKIIPGYTYKDENGNNIQGVILTKDQAGKEEVGAYPLEGVINKHFAGFVGTTTKYGNEINMFNKKVR